MKKLYLLILSILITFISCNRIDTSNPNNMLLSAAKVGRLDYVKMAVAKGADLNTRDRNGGTALHWAVYYNHKEIVEFLLMQGASPFIVDNQGVTPIDVARINNRKEILKIFEKYLNSKKSNN